MITTEIKETLTRDEKGKKPKPPTDYLRIVSKILEILCYVFQIAEVILK
jgi:hypothetical protein